MHFDRASACRDLILVFALLLAVPSLARAADSYAVVPLWGLSFAAAVNEAGVVAGAIPIGAFDSHAATSDGTTTLDLGTLGGSFSAAHDIDGSGLVVGESYTSGGSNRAFVWNGVSMSMLATLGDFSDVARGIDDAGVIVGSSALPFNTAVHAVRWENGLIVDLGTLGGNNSSAVDVNASGQIAGWAWTSTSTLRAALWQGGSVTDLGTLGGTRSRANAINDAGQVVGQAQVTGNTTWRAFLWEPSGMLDLGTLGGSQSEAYDINGSGQVVGVSQIPAGTTGGAFLWEDGTLYSINDLLVAEDSSWSINSAHSINDAGWIAGWGRLGTAPGVPVLLRPVPEPAIGNCLGVLALALLSRARRRRVRAPGA